MGIFGSSKSKALEQIKNEFVATQELIDRIANPQTKVFFSLALKFGFRFMALRLDAPDNIYKTINYVSTRRLISFTIAVFYAYIRYYYASEGRTSIIERDEDINRILYEYIYLQEEEKEFPIMLAFNSKNEDERKRLVGFLSFISKELHGSILGFDDYMAPSYLTLLDKICTTCFDEINDEIERLMYADSNDENDSSLNSIAFAKLDIYFGKDEYTIHIKGLTDFDFDQLLLMWGTYTTLVFCGFNEFKNKKVLKSNLAASLLRYNPKRDNIFDGTGLTLSYKLSPPATDLIVSGRFLKDEIGTMFLIPDFTPKTNEFNMSGSVMAFLQYLIDKSCSDQNLEFLYQFITVYEFFITNMYEEKDITVDEVRLLPYAVYKRLIEQGVSSS